MAKKKTPQKGPRGNNKDLKSKKANNNQHFKRKKKCKDEDEELEVVQVRCLFQDFLFLTDGFSNREIQEVL